MLARWLSDSFSDFSTFASSSRSPTLPCFLQRVVWLRCQQETYCVQYFRSADEFDLRHEFPPGIEKEMSVNDGQSEAFLNSDIFRAGRLV
jgi:hypothetical protein